MMAKVLIIDDDQILCERLVNYFNQFDIELIVANTPSQGLEKLDLERPQVLLLDVMLPETDGFTLCRAIRAKSPIPIIMLTARGELNDKIFGLELGADDYLAKPFEPRELIARIQVILRRNIASTASEDELHFEHLSIFAKSHQVLLDDKELKLTGMEFSLLMLLAKSPGEVFNRDQLLSELKGVDTEIYSRSIDILMSRLRQKLGDNPKQVRFIKTLRNVGYTFIARPA